MEIVADIDAMYHQVRVDLNDIDALNFMWFPDVISRNNQKSIKCLYTILEEVCLNAVPITLYNEQHLKTQKSLIQIFSAHCREISM